MITSLRLICEAGRGRWLYRDMYGKVEKVRSAGIRRHCTRFVSVEMVVCQRVMKMLEAEHPLKLEAGVFCHCARSGSGSMTVQLLNWWRNSGRLRRDPSGSVSRVQGACYYIGAWSQPLIPPSPRLSLDGPEILYPADQVSPSRVSWSFDTCPTAVEQHLVVILCSRLLARSSWCAHRSKAPLLYATGSTKLFLLEPTISSAASPTS